VTDDLARAFECIARADMAGTRAEPSRWGTAVFLPECPLRHDSNYLLVGSPPPGVDAAALAAEADRVQGPAGLRHRCVMVRDAAAGERLAPGFAALGWKAFRGVVMAHRRPAAPRPGTPPVARTDAESLRVAREAEILRYPWGTPEVARQILDARSHIPVETRHYAVFVDGEPASWAELYLDGDAAQVEAVATVGRFRNRGYAGAVVLHAVAEARRAGAGLVFLCADADDWPRDLYRRLGFDGIGAYAKFTRTPVGGAGAEADHRPGRGAGAGPGAGAGAAADSPAGPGGGGAASQPPPSAL
jgi:ribosomal protein S18 acetylase RimI-like enzyme